MNGAQTFFLVDTGTGVFLFWMHFRLSLWTAMHMHIRSVTPSMYLDFGEGRVEHDQANDCHEDCS